MLTLDLHRAVRLYGIGVIYIPLFRFTLTRRLNFNKIFDVFFDTLEAVSVYL